MGLILRCRLQRGSVVFSLKSPPWRRMQYATMVKFNQQMTHPNIDTSIRFNVLDHFNREAAKSALLEPQFTESNNDACSKGPVAVERLIGCLYWG